MGDREAALHRKFNLEEPWDSPHNMKLLDEMPDFYKTDPTSNRLTSIHVVVSGSSLFANDALPTVPPEVQVWPNAGRLGVLVVADRSRAVEWTKPGGIEAEPDKFFEVLGNPPLRCGYPAATAAGGLSILSKSANPAQAFRYFMTADRDTADDTKDIVVNKQIK